MAASPEDQRPDTTLDRARRQRRETTQPERALWRELRELRGLGYRFRRQAPIGPDIADFFEPARRLVIVRDGESHADRGGYDRSRDAWMQMRQLHVFRVSNDDVIADVGAVVEAIIAYRHGTPDVGTIP
jgi:very-short-patch-repair endonuclease